MSPRPFRRTLAAAPPLTAQTTVRELMTYPARSVTADAPLEEVRHLLIEAEISGVPVVDADGRPLGVLSKSDLVRWGGGDPAECEELVEDRDAAARLGYEARVTRLREAKVREVMTRRTVTIPESAPAVQAAQLMAEHRVHRVIAVDASGKARGILTSFDVLRWLGHAALA